MSGPVLTPFLSGSDSTTDSGAYTTSGSDNNTSTATETTDNTSGITTNHTEITTNNCLRAACSLRGRVIFSRLHNHLAVAGVGTPPV